jgi:hypothetical protein
MTISCITVIGEGRPADQALRMRVKQNALHTRQPIMSIIAPLDEYLDQAQQHGTRRQLLEATVTTYLPPDLCRSNIRLRG